MIKGKYVLYSLCVWVLLSGSASAGMQPLGKQLNKDTLKTQVEKVIIQQLKEKIGGIDDKNIAIKYHNLTKVINNIPKKAGIAKKILPTIIGHPRSISKNLVPLIIICKLPCD